MLPDSEERGGGSRNCFACHLGIRRQHDARVDRQDMFAVVRKLLELLSARERTHLLFLTVAIVGLALIETAGVASIMPFIAVVHNPDVIQSNQWLQWAYRYFGFSGSGRFLFALGSMVLALLIFTNIYKALINWWRLDFDNRLNFALGRRILAQYMARPYPFFLDRNTSDMGKNVLAEVRVVINGVLSSGIQLLSGLLVCLCLLTLLIVIDPFIALMIMAILSSLYGGIYWLASRRLARISKEQVQANSMKFKFASEALSGIKDLKILGRELVFLNKFSHYAWRQARNNVTAGMIYELPRYALEVIAFGGILLIMLYYLGSAEGADKMIPLLALYAFAGYRLLPAVQAVFSNASVVRTTTHALDVLHEDLVSEQGGKEPEAALARPADLQPLPFARELEIKNIGFRYARSNKAVLSGLNLTIHPYSSVGLVGPTGSGKTTIVDLVLGLLSPTSGQILVDGVKIAGDDLIRWQRNLGYVPQSIFLCDDSITSNIAFGVPEEEIDKAAVIRAARIANLHGFIEKELPDSYETLIGERGVRLSGGQRQRIGIARALYRDPAVLIMDEATSALDGITEEAVIEALRALAGKKTMLTIAHRLTTVKDCSIIYLIDEGRIVGHGTYAQLLETSAWFRTAARVGT
jgi:ABC-type multidrug transport system fused ATPase/permease subunit